MDQDETRNSPENDTLVNYRLTQIEGTLNKLVVLLEDNKMQQRDIDDLKKEASENRDAINAHEKRIAALEKAPLQQKAENWQKIVDSIFKGVLTIAGLALLAYLGIKK